MELENDTKLWVPAVVAGESYIGCFPQAGQPLYRHQHSLIRQFVLRRKWDLRRRLQRLVLGHCLAMALSVDHALEELLAKDEFH